jgi:hypothetical protein
MYRWLASFPDLGNLNQDARKTFLSQRPLINAHRKVIFYTGDITKKVLEFGTHTHTHTHTESA